VGVYAAVGVYAGLGFDSLFFREGQAEHVDEEA
jgi:hypothetical protein